MSIRLIERLIKHGRNAPNEPALVRLQTNEIWTWRQLNQATANVAARLRQRSPRGIAMLCAGNEPAFVAAFLGALAAGWQIFPISPQSPAPEREALAESAGATYVLNPKDVSPDGNTPLEFTDASDSALLLHSSGSTGRPKIVRRDSRSLDAVCSSISESVGMASSDHVLGAAPLCHSYGLEHGLLAPVWAGSCVHLCDNVELPVLVKAFAGAITIFPGVPYLFELLSQSQCGRANLRKAYSAGGLLGHAAALAFKANFGVAVGQVYGTTEVGSATFSDPSDGRFDPASVGRAMPGVRIAIDEEFGEVLIESDSMFDCYVGVRRDESQVGPDGFYRTGDVGRIDESGNLILTGRRKLMIDVGGRKVNPLEVEQVLADHPAVGKCVVIPMSLGTGVTRLKAVVTPRVETRQPSAVELRQFVKERLASYKVPREFEVRRDLPCSAAGKVLRDQVQG